MNTLDQGRRSNTRPLRWNHVIFSFSVAFLLSGCDRSGTTPSKDEGLGSPRIASVSSIRPDFSQRIIISGSNFGATASCNGYTPWLRIVDLTRNWSAGHVSAQGCQKVPSVNGDAASLNISSWSPAQIVVDGIGRNNRGSTVLEPGDRIEIQVWNPQTQRGPTAYHLWVADASVHRTGFPEIRSITLTVPSPGQGSIIISGTGFGALNPCNGDTRWLEVHVQNSYQGWNAGYNGSGFGCQSGSGGDLVTLNITSWTPTQIVIGGFSGPFFSLAVNAMWSLFPDAQIQVRLWNPQTGEGPAIGYTGMPSRIPVEFPTIRSVTPVATTNDQIITIYGSAFGSGPPCNGDLPWIQITDLTRKWSAGHAAGPLILSSPAGCVTGSLNSNVGPMPMPTWTMFTSDFIFLNVKSWTPERIVIAGLTGQHAGPSIFQPGDQVEVQVWNRDSGQGPTRFTTLIISAAQTPLAPSGASDAGGIVQILLFGVSVLLLVFVFVRVIFG